MRGREKEREGDRQTGREKEKMVGTEEKRGWWTVREGGRQRRR